ncbi:MAG: 16S rRNA (cytosine(1402)-N(4))-methyltransferase RsmH [Eubacteriales bacterium]|nr:16S rRNA (cytosine(1402)-N(4))-methyltransferase RsmH [Eubacteriales bacterium]
MSEFHHVSIMLPQCVAYLAPERGGIFVDGTLGGAGHAQAVLAKMQGHGSLIGIDLDDRALAAAAERLSPFGDSFCGVKGNFKDIKSILEQQGVPGIDGALLDLGVSSPQLDEAQRGFSYHNEAPLDMRMDQSAAFSAYDVVNGYSPQALAKVIFAYGEERFARRIADFIARERQDAPIETTVQLSEIITQAIPAKFRRQGPHPARRTFQAIRIEVNHELEGLGQAITDFIDVLNPGGRLCVITFHSLEDRAVKEAMKTAQDPCICPKDFPVCVCGRVSKGKMDPRKPVQADEAEVEENPRSRSAKLRVFRKA